MKILSSICSNIVKFSNENSGSIAIVTSLTAIPVIMMTGFAYDHSRVVSAKLDAQSKLDSALVLASNNDADDREEIVLDFFQQAGSSEEWYDATVNAELVNENLIKGQAVVKVKPIFGALWGQTPLKAKVTGSAITESVLEETSVPSSDSGNACILLKDPWSSMSLIYNSGADLQAPECEVHVQSEGNYAAAINSGINIDVKRTCIAADNIINNYGDLPGLETSCETIDDPFENALPAPPSTNCQHWHGNHNGGTVNLQPGVYCGWKNFNNATTVNFAPGVYVIKNGGWNVNGGTWTGNGVTFYFHDRSKIQFNSGVSADLTPPASGDYAGIMIYERENLSTSNFILNDTNDFGIEGLIYLPSRNTIYNSGAAWRERELTMVFNKLTLNNAKLKLSAGPKSIPTEEGTTSTQVTQTVSYTGRLVD